MILNTSITEYLIETVSLKKDTLSSGGENSIRTIDVSSQILVKEIIWTLNRKDIVQFTGDTELLSAEAIHTTKEKERVEKHIINANSIDTLMQVEDLANKYELNTIFKTKKQLLQNGN